MANPSNHAQLSGNLTRDPELIESIGLVKFSIAVEGAGRENNETVAGFYDIAVWTKPSKFTPAILGESVMAAYKDGSLCKGARVNVSGRLVQERFLTKDNTKASRITLTADSLSIVMSREQREARQSGSAPSGESAAAPPQSASAGEPSAPRYNEVPDF